jgi:hypothetical protein
MIVERISYIPPHVWLPAKAHAPTANRNDPAVSTPGEPGIDEDGDLPPTVISAPISPRSWPRVFPGL